jgi:hypothetical protein
MSDDLIISKTNALQPEIFSPEEAFYNGAVFKQDYKPYIKKDIRKEPNNGQRNTHETH